MPLLLDVVFIATWREIRDHYHGQFKKSVSWSRDHCAWYATELSLDGRFI